MFDIIKEEKTFLNLREDWCSLFSQCHGTTPFQSFDYVYSFWKLMSSSHYSLYILVLSHDNTRTVEAIFPTALSDKGVLSFIGQDYSDFCSAIVHPDFDNYTTYELLSHQIKKDAQIKSAVLGNLQGTNPLLSVLKPFFSYHIVSICSFYSIINICPKEKDSDFVDAFKSLNAKGRKNLRTINKKNNTNLVFSILRKSENHIYPQTEIESLVSLMINDGIRTREYFSEKMLSFWKELYEKKLLIISVLSTEGITQSVNFMYYNESRNEYIKWIMLYRDSKWNMVMNLRIAESLYQRGGATINFARGIYDYKLVNYHPDVCPLFQLTIIKEKKEMLVFEVHNAIEHIKNVIKILIK